MRFLMIIGLIILPIHGWAASKVTSVDFKGTQDPSEIEIQTDGPVTFEKQENAQDNQVIIELKGASISKGNSRKIDTSSFNSNVNLISPYQVDGQPDTVRVVVQLRKPGAVDISQEGNLIHVKVPSANIGEVAAATNPNNPNPTSDSDESGQTKTKIEEFMDSKSTKRFSGKPVTLQVRDVDVGDVLRLIGDASGFNIVVGDDVKGKLTLSLVDVPWDQALDVVLHSLHLGAERNNNILRVVTLQNLTQEKQEELRAQRAVEASAPRVTRVFPISYANLGDLQSILTKFATTPQTANAASTPDASVPAIVQADNRTNSIIVRDLPDNIERMKKLVELLDTQTPQVIIEAKVIEATEGFSKTLGGSLGIGTNSSSTTAFSSFAGGNPLDALVGSPGVFSDGSGIATQSSPSGGTPLGIFGVSPSLSFIPGGLRLNALLNWGESESQVKIVSSPKTVVLNKERAQIMEGTPVLVPGTTTVAGVGTVPTTSVQSANVGLSVRPTVTNDGSVLMDLTVTKDVPITLPGGNSGIGNRNMSTLVLVESGSTLVIGGIYTMQSSHTSSGFPILRKIPIIGALFGNDTENTDRSELFIFITPKILNPKEAGLSS